MTKKDWKNIADFFRFVFKRDPKLTLSTILFGVMQIFQPYVLIFMSGYLVDAVYNGQGLRTCITIALVGLGLSTVAGMISDRFEEWFYQRLEYIHE